MLKTPEKISAGRASGFSLVELMVSVAIGLVVLGGVVGIFASSVKGNADALKMTRLNQELQAVMGMMTRDIRRAGYWGNATSAIGPPATFASNNNPFTLDAPSPDSCNEPRVDCGPSITFSYDINGDGIPTSSPNECFGFRLGSGVLQSRTSGGSCGTDSWEGITDGDSVQITQLLFTLKSQPPIDIDGPATPSPPGVCVTGCGTSTINVREVQITLSGWLKNDTSVTREIIETVRIRNDLWTQ